MLSVWSTATTTKPWLARRSATVISENRVQSWQCENAISGNAPVAGRASTAAWAVRVGQPAGAAASSWA